MASRALLAPPPLAQPHPRQALSAHHPSVFPSHNNNMMPSNMAANDHASDQFLYPNILPLSLPSIVHEYQSMTQQQVMTHPSISNATVVSNAPSSASSALATTESMAATPPSVIIANAPSAKKNHDRTDRRHALPTSILLPNAQAFGEAVTHPVPEFLCHLFTMLTDPQLSDIMSWSVPVENESNIMGGGKKGIGKIVVHNPERLQSEVLGKYYRHSCYASFQRQLNYFGFKKRLHGGKKGKLSPCSYVHDGVGDEPASLFQLKRRPPSKKRAATESDPEEKDSVSSVSLDQEEKKHEVKKAKKGQESAAGTKSAKKPRANKKSTKNGAKKEKGRVVSFDFMSPSCDPLNMAICNSLREDSLLPNFENIVIPPNMPLMARAEGISPLLTSSSSSPTIENLVKSNTLIPNVDAVPSGYDNGITAMRANAAVREAQKSLERAYRKSQKEHEERDQTRNFGVVTTTVQSQPNSNNLTSVPDPLSQMEPFSTPMWNNMNYSYSYAHNNAVVLNNDRISTSASQQVPMNASIPGIRSDASSPVEFDDVFSKLLSTTLPSSEELFGDELSSGSLTEEDLFVGSGLHVVDDGMLLP
mmetsp:Transcript_22814/g.45572  ORF Transcript_22814/g.45572 Transcript_22814/m.45572 type:complete len:589 (+) Transcript_22814:142-1908(+)